MWHFCMFDWFSIYIHSTTRIKFLHFLFFTVLFFASRFCILLIFFVDIFENVHVKCLIHSIRYQLYINIPHGLLRAFDVIYSIDSLNLVLQFIRFVLLFVFFFVLFIFFCFDLYVLWMLFADQKLQNNILHVQHFSHLYVCIRIVFRLEILNRQCYNRQYNTLW